MNNLNKALRCAKKIPLAQTYKDKQKAVHAWAKAVKDMLNGSN